VSLLFPLETPARRGTAAALISPLAVCLFAIFLIVYVLPPPLPILPDRYLLDPSWQIELTKAFLRGAQFGRDIIYTYGPWGFLEYPRGDALIYPWLLSGRLLIATAFVLGLSHVAHRHIRQTFRRILFAVAVAMLADPVYVLPVLLFVMFFSARRNALVHVLAVASALTMWIKFTSFVTVGVLAGIAALDDGRRRRFPLVAAETAAATLALWVAAGQPLSGLVPFLHGALSTSISYGTEMSLQGPAWEAWLALVLVIAIAAHCALYAVPRLDLRRLSGACWLILLFFLQLKESFIRHDSFHVWMGMVNGLIPSGLVLLCATGAFGTSCCAGSRRRRNAPAVVVVALSLVFVALQLPSLAFAERVQSVLFNAEGLGQLLSGARPSAQLQKQITEFKRAKPLPAVTGNVALFPDYQAMLYGNSLDAVLSPVPQGFAAYNSYLSELNADFFRSARRPDYVFFDVLPIDGRYPSASDALSWRAFLDCYSPQSEQGGYLLLRASGCRGLKLQPITEAIGELGAGVPVPRVERGGVWVAFEIAANPTGRLAAIVAKPPALQLVVETAAGKHLFRTTAETGRTGFLLSPFIADRHAFAGLYADGQHTVVDRLTIVNPDTAPGSAWTRIAIRYYRLELPRNAANP